MSRRWGRRPLLGQGGAASWCECRGRARWGRSFALVPGWQRRPVRHRGGGEVGGGAVHLVGERTVGQTLLLVSLADEAWQGELVVGGQTGGVAEALRPGRTVLLDGTGLGRDTRQIKVS